MPSIHIACSNAAKQLLEDPDQIDPANYGGIEGIFTELDVLLRAATSTGGWDDLQWRQAQREASQVMGALFRTRQVVRFGPVLAPGMSEPDYLRVASKIIYTSSENGPLEISTPNGVFRRLFIETDPIARQGRRAGTNRNDLERWDEQDPLAGGSPSSREILRLRAELANITGQLRQAETEVHRLREHAATFLTREQVEELVESKLNQRLRGAA